MVVCVWGVSLGVTTGIQGPGWQVGSVMVTEQERRRVVAGKEQGNFRDFRKVRCVSW